MTIQRVALIFDNTARPETTGLYCRRALGALVEVEHFLPEQMAAIPREGFDLYLQIDDGRPYQLADDLRPSALWAIDTHVDFEAAWKKAVTVDHVFCAQKDGAERMRARGLDAIWLPLACDPELHGRRNVELQHDVAFVGNLFPGPRNDRLAAIRDKYPNTYIGRRYFEEMAETYSSARIAFNQSVAHDVNMRVFETLCAGSLLVTNQLDDNGLPELFRDGEHLVTFADERDLLDKLERYLGDDTARERIAERGQAEVVSRHTYLHRMTRLLRLIERGIAGDEIPRSTALTPLGWSSDTPLSPQSVSACLLSWKRPDNVRQIVAGLRKEPLIDDIVVWNNNPDMRLDLDEFDDVTVIDAERNEVTYGRFLAARHARHDVIYTQDDDCLVHNIAELAETFRLDDSRIAHNLKLGHLAAGSDDRFETAEGVAQMALLGWGALFDRRWIKALDLSIERHGRDELLRRKADRLFALLQHCRHRSIPAQVTDLRGASGKEALSVRDDHVDLTRHSIARALQLLAEKTNADETRRRHHIEPDSTGVSVAAAETKVKDTAYFDHSRPELLERIPQSAARVLDVGCAAGRLGETLKRRQTCQVWGVERDTRVAQTAANRLDRIINVDAESLNGELRDVQFDCIVCGDVLEHLRDPQTFLQRARDWLSPDGRLIASLPNVRHHTVLRSLLEGNFTYEPAGLLDDDHVRFFTRREIEKLFFRAGYKIDNLSVVPGPGHRQWVDQGRPLAIQTGSLSYRARHERDAEDLFAYQYLIEAASAPAVNDGLTSIVIVTHNQLQHSHACIESIRHLTDEPYELIFVDNGSTDGTPDYLESFANATVIRNDDNRGFPAAVNQGLEVATGDNILLLNNDTIVTTGWLRRMLDALHSDPAIGLVGPVSNNVSGAQQIAVDYDDLAALDGFAWDETSQHAGERIPTDRLVGFCLLFERALLNAVGRLDERFGIGNFEDDDFCRRASHAGYKAVIARDAFVHHEGGATFRATGVDFSALMTENRRKFDEKWNGSESTASVETPEPLPADRESLQKTPAFRLENRGGGLLLSEDRPRVSLCMIVRDNERTIRPALESIKPWVDEMIVVDTGSTDATPDICRELGARVEQFAWCDDFSAARNESLKYASGEWLFWMDSDDTMPAACGRRLRSLVDENHRDDVYGYVMQVHCPSPDDRTDLTVVDHVKMFRNRSDLRFEHRIHEQILPAIRRAGGEVEFTDVFVVHSGADRTPEGRQRKLERDYRLLKLDLQERPDHPFVLFNLGMTYDDDGRHEEAIECLRRSLMVSDPGSSHSRKAYALLVGSLTAIGQFEAAEQVCRDGLQEFPDDPEIQFRLANIHLQLGRLRQAEQVYRQLLDEKQRDRVFSSVNPAITGFKAQHNLALVYKEMERLDEAEALWQKIVDSGRRFRPAWRELGECAVARGDDARVREIVEYLSLDEMLAPEADRLQASVYEHASQPMSALDSLRRSHVRYPRDESILEDLCRLSFYHAPPEEADRYLRRLIAESPHDGAAHHNLGIVQIRLNRRSEAIEAFRKSLEFRPNSPQTRAELEAVAGHEWTAGDEGRHEISGATDPIAAEHELVGEGK